MSRVRRLSRRDFLRYSTVAGVGLVAVACTPAASPTQAPSGTQPTAAPSGSQPTAAPAQPTQAAAGTKVLNVGLYREMRGLDPAVYEGEPETMATTMIYDRLVCLGSDKQYHPWLAKSWETSDDGKVWTFKLRDDVVFHDGTKFNAEAVKFHLDRSADPATKSLKAGALLEPYEKSEVVDATTIKITLKKAFGPFLDVLAGGYMGIPSPTAVQKYGAQFEEHNVGSGPFKFVEWQRQNYLILEKNPDYKWGPECADNKAAPHLDRLVFKFVPESETREALFDRGEEINAMTHPTPAGLARWQAAPDKFTIWSMMGPGTPWLQDINVSKAPTDELAVRQAMNYAVDRKTIVDTLFKGISEPCYGVLAPTTLYYNEQAGKQYTYDPKKAMDLLEQAGWVDANGDGVREKNGKPLEIEIHLRPDQQKEAYCEIVAQQLAAVGFNCKIRSGTQEQRTQLGQAGTLNGIGVATEGFDPNYLTLCFHSKAYDAYNFSKVKDPELDAALDEADSAVDPEKRKAAMFKVQQIIMDKAYVLPIHAPYFFWVARSNVTGLKGDANGWWPYFQDVDLKQ